MTRAGSPSFVLLSLISILLLALAGCNSDVAGPNRAPVAVAGPDLQAPLGSSVTLDGSASVDPDGDPLTYAWQVLSRPEASSAEPVDATSQVTTLLLDEPGRYLVALTVSDGELQSDRDVMQVTAAGCESDAECADDLFCTENERCDNGVCMHDARDCRAAGDDCNTGVCDEDANACAAEPVADGEPCDDDGLFCNGTETCQSGTCVGSGNPCTPEDSCDEDNDLCGGCGDGVVSDGEDCDPGAPRNDFCCDPTTCTWAAAGEADPQGTCSGAPECQLDVCDGSGGCDTAQAPDGTACGSASDTLCDDPDTCVAGQCEANIASAGTLCRAASDLCDVEEVCDGSNADCPADEVAGAGVVCREAAGACDAVEVCDGSSASCPADLRLGAETECPASTDADCDPAEVCDGVNVDCPADGWEMDGTACSDDGLFCTGDESCLLGVCTNEGNPCPNPDDCDEGVDLCGACGDGIVGTDEDCDPGAPQNDHCCNVGDCTWAANGNADPQNFCSGAAECYVDVCDGSGGCDTAQAPDGTACGSDSDTACDDPDTCSGGVCQDNLELAGTLCNASTGACDPEEVCDGVSPDCPSDVLASNGTECRPSEGACDLAEVCDGSNPVCPADVLEAAGQECREAAGVCDVAETCDGVSADCPDDVVATAGTECREANGLCDVAENCDGTNVDCPADGVQASGVECREPAGVCDLAETCDGTNPACPADVYDASSECRSALGGACDVAETCDGTGPDCPADGVASAGTECRASTGDCDPAETCDGSNAGCPTNLLASLGTPCEEGDLCSSSDTCGDGDGVCNASAIDKDTDNDTFIDGECTGGNDCNDEDPDVYPGAPAEGAGNVCDAAGSCFDLADNDCDGDTDAADADCDMTDHMCLYGPEDDVSVDGSGDTITVRLDASLYDVNNIVCVTDTSRLVPDVPLLANDFESDLSGFNTDDGSNVRRENWAQNPAGTGNTGVAICRTHYLVTDAIDTTGMTRIRLRYAASVYQLGLDNEEYGITEYSIDGSTWYQLNVEGDDYRENWQWYNFILPPRCEGESTLYIRWRVAPTSGSMDCLMLDDVVISDAADPTVSWTLLANDFEPGANGTADVCADDGGWALDLFDTWGTSNNEICLRSDAAYSGSQGLRVLDDDPNYVQDSAIDSTYVPAGSDLIASFRMQSENQGNDDYSNAWYSVDGGGNWLRMAGVGLSGTEDYDWFRFVMDPAALGITDLAVEFRVPSAANNGGGDGFYLDDYDLTWTRASHDEFSGFTDNGDGTYSAVITSDLEGTANVTCYFYGTSGTEVTDGNDENSGPAEVTFVP